MAHNADGRKATRRRTALLNSLAALPTFAARKRACDAALPLLGTGSSRTVYDLGNGTVLKLAKNKKGLAQNETESDYCMRQWHGEILAKTVNVDSVGDGYTWIVQQYASTACKRAFVEQFGVSVEEIGIYLAHYCFPYNRYLLPQAATHDAFRDQKRLAAIVDCALNFDLHCGDLGRLSSWGILRGKLVLKDYGLTRSNYEEYYARKREYARW